MGSFPPDASSEPEPRPRPALPAAAQQEGVQHSPTWQRPEMGVPLRADVLERHAAQRVSNTCFSLIHITLSEEEHMTREHEH